VLLLRRKEGKKWKEQGRNEGTKLTKLKEEGRKEVEGRKEGS
jgi:hypothetical protein